MTNLLIVSIIAWMFAVAAALTFQTLTIHNLMRVNRALTRRMDIMEEITFKHLGIPL